jgi:tartrate dehydrogenase/decarboxylase/D-malate dehydrogenase
MMTEHLGETEASKDIEAAVNKVLQNGDIKTRDMGGTHSTAEMGTAVKKALLSP